MGMNTTTPSSICELPPYNSDFRFSIILYTCIYGPIILAGVIVNVINLIVIDRLNNPVYTTIKILAGFDLFFMISALFLYPVRTLYLYGILGEILYHINDWYFGWWFITVSQPFFYATQMARNWSIILISLERLIVVAFPLNYQKIWNSKTLCCLLTAIIVTSVFSNWNHFVPDVLPGLWQWPCLKPGQFAYTIFFEGTPVTRFSIPRVQYNDGYLLYVVGTVSLPYLLMCAVNVALLIFVKLADKRRRNMTTTPDRLSSSKDKQILKMVAAVLAIFFVCEAPAIIERLEGLINGKETPLTHEQRMALRKFALASSMFDSVINFFAYCAVNRSFRKTFRDMLERKSLRS